MTSNPGTDAVSSTKDNPLPSPFASFHITPAEDIDRPAHGDTFSTAAAAPAVRAASGHPSPPVADQTSSSTPLRDTHGPSSAPAATGSATQLPDTAAQMLDQLSAVAGAASSLAQSAADASRAATVPSVDQLSKGGSRVMRSASSGSVRKKRLIPLRQVLRHSYEYHGLNELFMFCITALAVTMVLYWHWGSYTSIFKASVQQSFQSFGNPDWQMQYMKNVDTMYDAVEYSMGWLEFWLQRAEDLDLPENLIRAQDYADVQYVRILVNLDRNCDPSFHPHLSCYLDDPLYEPMLKGEQPYGPYNLSHPRNQYPCKSGKKECLNPDLDIRGYANLLEWAGWENVFHLSNRDSSAVKQHYYWWAYTVVAPKYYGQDATRDDHIGRMYNITRQSNLNNDDCDWLASDCSVSPNPCSNVPFQDWFSSATLCPNGTGTKDVLLSGPGVQRGNRTFVRDPTAGEGNILDLKSYLSKYAYSIVVDVMAANTLGDLMDHTHQIDKYDAVRDRALFSMAFQRSAEASGTPDRVMWQITTTVPVRTSFYAYSTDQERIGFEILLLVCVAVVLFTQVWQFRICQLQFRSWKPFFAHYWNDYEIVSTLLLVAWIIFYLVLLIGIKIRHQNWRFEDWDVVTLSPTSSTDSDPVNAHYQLENLTTWANAYGAWLYIGIVVDFLIFVRLARYMRVHVGLKAFYQVFIIAGREFLDFAVFLLFILVVLGSAIFAFFQLTGGNAQFLRFGDGLALMTRLTFGFLAYEDFQAQALGVGAFVSTVTLLFWLAVILLVVYTQNIILAIVAEAYEEAKAKLGTAETSFLMLVLMRLLFFFLYIGYRAKMLCVDLLRLITGKQRLTPLQQSRTSSRNLNAADDSPGSPGKGDGTSGNQAPAGSRSDTFADDRSSTDQGVVDSDPYVVNGDMMPSYSIMGVLPKDVESGLKPGPVSSVITTPRSGTNSRATSPIRRFQTVFSTSRSRDADGSFAARGALASAPSMKETQQENMSFGHRLRLLWYGLVSERHDVRMYKDLLIAPKEKDDGWIAAWKRRYWAPWCVARTKPVNALASIYQDFTSYKLKEECTWLQAHELARSIFAAAPSDQPGGHPVATWSGLPPLTDISYVDEDTLSRLFLLVNKMSEAVPICFSPFPPLTRQSVGYLVQGISEVYGRDEDEVMALIGNNGLDAAQASMVTPGSSVESKDALLGQVAPRRGNGFFSQLNAKRREGGGNDSKHLTMLLHAQRRLEEMAHKTERSLDLYRSQAVQQANLTAKELTKQQSQQTEVLKAVRAIQTTMQDLTASRRQGSGLPAVSSPRAEEERSSSSRHPALKKGVSIKKAGGALLPFPWTSAAASRAGSEVLGSFQESAAAVGSSDRPPDRDTTLGPSQPAGATSSSSGAGGRTAATGAGPSGAATSTAVSDAHVEEVIACLKQQLQDQQQILNLLTGRQQQGQGRRS